MIEYQDILIGVAVGVFMWALLAGTVYMKYHRTVDNDLRKERPFNIDQAMFLFIIALLLMLAAGGVEGFRVYSRELNATAADHPDLAKPTVISDILGGAGAALAVFSWVFYFIFMSSPQKASK